MSDKAKAIAMIAATAVLAGALAWGAPHWRERVSAVAPDPVRQSLGLLAAALVGVVVTRVHKLHQRDKPPSRSLEQAQILLCVSGALMMIVIGDSLARAFGIAGAASIVRFRTPVEDPKDTVILFLVLGLGMSCGLGAVALAGMGTAFLCLLLLWLDRERDQKPRAMMLELVAQGREFPAEHVHTVFSQYGVVSEPRGFCDGPQVLMKYHVRLDPGTSLKELSARLMNGGGTGLKSIAWEAAKKKG